MKKNKRKYNEHDVGYKSILSNKKNFIDFLRSFVKKDWVNLIEEENLVLIDKEFIQEDFKEEEADIVYKVNIKGKDIIFYVLVELQSKNDFRMPIRLLMYMTEIYREELKNTEEKIKRRKEYRLPAIVPIVLYNGKNNWSAVRSFKEILNGYEMFEENVIDFKYLLFDINRMEKEELLEIANVVSSIFLLDQDVEIDEIVDRLKLIGRIIRNSATKEQEKSFRNWIINIFRNRFEEEESIYELLEKTSTMEVDDMVSNLGRKIEEAFKNKKAEGRAEEKKALVKNLLLVGVEIEKIVKASGLNKEDVEKIQREIQH